MTRLPFVLLLLAISLSCGAQAPPCPTESAISIARGSFEAKSGVQYQLTNFQARLVPKARTAPQYYERTTVVSRAEIFVSSESLTRVFAEKLQASHSKIRDFTVKHDTEGATLAGSITKVIPVHFSIKGPVSTDGNSIRLDAKSVKAVKGMKGIEIGEDHLAFSPQDVADLKGHIASVRTSDAGLTIFYTPLRHRLLSGGKIQ